MSEFGCARVCVMAQEDVCNCRCEGQNHGKARIEWLGYFCEGCDFHFGYRPFDNGAYASTGRSTKYQTVYGKPASGYYCWPCYRQAFPANARYDENNSELRGYISIASQRLAMIREMQQATA